VQLRGARTGCTACNGGDVATSDLTRAGGPAGYDYASFTGGQALEERGASVALLPPEMRLDCQGLRELLSGGGAQVLLLDVRSEELFAVGHLRESINVPIGQVRIQPGPVSASDYGSYELSIVRVCSGCVSHGLQACRRTLCEHSPTAMLIF
jgi:hypothetical protein